MIGLLVTEVRKKENNNKIEEDKKKIKEEGSWRLKLEALIRASVR